MVVTRIVSVLTMAALAGLLALVPARAERISNFKIGNWDGGAYTHSGSGAFSHCAASASYRSGTTLVFSIHKDLTWAFGLVNRNWKLKPGETYEVRYWIDRGRPFFGTAEVVAANQVKVPMPGNDRLFGAVRRGRLMTVDAANQTMQFALTSTNRMLSALFDCARYWRSRNLGSTRNPFSDGDPGGNSANPFSNDKKDADPRNPFTKPEATAIDGERRAGIVMAGPRGDANL